MARIVEATVVVKSADGGTYELLLERARGLDVRRVRRPRRPWQRERDDIVVTFVSAGPAQTHKTPPEAPEVEDPDWEAYTNSLPREDHPDAA